MNGKKIIGLILIVMAIRQIRRPPAAGNNSPVADTRQKKIQYEGS